MTIKELIKDLQHLCYELPDGDGTQVLIEIENDDINERSEPYCYIDDETNEIIISYHDQPNPTAP